MHLRTIEVQREQPAILVIRPIAEVLSGEECRAKKLKREFRIELPLPKDLTNQTMIHVRVMNGDSISKIFADLRA